MKFKNLTLAGIILAYSLFPSPNVNLSPTKYKNNPKHIFCIENDTANYDLDLDGIEETISSKGDKFKLIDGNDKKEITLEDPTYYICVFKDRNFPLIYASWGTAPIGPEDMADSTYFIWTGERLYKAKFAE